MVISTIRSATNWLFLSLTMLYLALGNVPRFLPVGAGKSGVLATEVLFYFLTLTFLLVNLPLLAIPIEAVIISLVVLASYFVGAIQHGYDLTAFLYGARFILLVLGSFSLGVALRWRYKTRIDKALSWSFLYPLIISTLIGWVLYFLFPQSEQLWLALKLYGIEFAGDPHAHRLLSSYFDPNYFSAIAVFGVVLALALHRITSLGRYLVCAIFLSVSIFFTLSRSGIATLVMVLALLLFPQLRAMKITKWRIFGGLAVVGAIFFAYPLYSEAALRLLSRFFNTNLQSDGSSLARFHVAELGFAGIRDNFLFGIGFNYVPDQYDTMTAFDSSVMQVLVTMGGVGGVFFISMFAIFSIRSLRGPMLLEYSNNTPRIAFATASYLFVSITFAALFDNLFFYQFWFVPVFSTLTYLSGFGERRSVESTPRRSSPLLPTVR